MFLKFFPLYTLALWAADDGGASGGGTSTGEGGTGGDSGQAGAGDAGNGAPTGGDTSGNGSDPTFTQADLDRIAGKTRKEALATFAKEHGFDSASELEAIIKAKKEADDQAKTDLEKAQADAQREKTAREQTEQRLYSAVLRAAFDRAAGDLVADLDLAFLAAQSAGLLSADGGIEVDADKQSVTGLDKAIETLLKDKPILKKTSQAAPAGTGGADGGNTPAAPTKEADDQARRTYGIKPQRS